MLWDEVSSVDLEPRGPPRFHTDHCEVRNVRRIAREGAVSVAAGAVAQRQRPRLHGAVRRSHVVEVLARRHAVHVADHGVAAAARAASASPSAGRGGRDGWRRRRGRQGFVDDGGEKGVGPGGIFSILPARKRRVRELR